MRPFDPDYYFTTRIDHRFADKSFLFGRITRNSADSRGFEGNLPAIGPLWQVRSTRAFNVSYSQTLRSNLLNDFRYGFSYNDQPRNGALVGKEVVKDLGIQGLADNIPDINGMLKVSFSGIGVTPLTQTDWRHPGFKNFSQQFQEQLSWFRGRHSLKAGLLVNRIQFQDNQAPANLFGAVTFSSTRSNCHSEYRKPLPAMRCLQDIYLSISEVVTLSAHAFA